MSLLSFEIKIFHQVLFCMMSILLVADLACIQGVYCRFGRASLYHFLLKILFM